MVAEGTEVLALHNNNNHSGVIQCPLVRHQHDAARRKAKNTTTHLQRPFKATGGADLRTSQAHAHRCLGAPTVSERTKRNREKVDNSLFLGVSLSATPSLDVGMARGLDWQWNASFHAGTPEVCGRIRSKNLSPFLVFQPREGSRCIVPDPLGWSAWRDTWRRGRPKGAGSVATAPSRVSLYVERALISIGAGSVSGSIRNAVVVDQASRLLNAMSW